MMTRATQNVALVMFVENAEMGVRVYQVSQKVTCYVNNLTDFP